MPLTYGVRSLRAICLRQLRFLFHAVRMPEFSDSKFISIDRSVASSSTFPNQQVMSLISTVEQHFQLVGSTCILHYYLRFKTNCEQFVSLCHRVMVKMKSSDILLDNSRVLSGLSGAVGRHSYLIGVAKWRTVSWNFFYLVQVKNSLTDLIH